MLNTNDKKDLKILVIDDEQGIRDLLSYELSMQGYTVITAGDGEDGLSKIRTNNINLVISDIKMPKMDGIKTLEEIKKINPEIEVIMATGYGTIDTAVDSMKKGAYDFVQKPFNINEIAVLVEKALEKAELKSLIALYETSKAIFSALKLSELLPVLAKISVDLLKADDVSIMMLDDKKKLYLAASQGLDNDSQKSARLDIGSRVLEKSDEVKGLVVLGAGSPEPLSGDQGVSSCIVSMLRAKNDVVGVLCVSRTKSKLPFSGSDKRYTEIFAAQVSQAIENARLYNTLEVKIKDLNEAYSKLSEMQKELVQAEKLAAIGELASGVAHELNNPLTVVIGLVQLMIEEGGFQSEKKKDLETIKEQAERCRRIILNLLQFSRKHETQKALVKINDVVEKCIELVEYDFKNSGIAVKRGYEDSIPFVMADFYQMQQVFLNVLTNAVHSLKFSKNPEISINIRKVEKMLQIEFVDNGCGIPDSVIDKIFDPFFTTKDVKSGTGLGLSISYGIVNEHGGKIYVNSKVNAGSHFFIELPIAD